MVRSWDNTIYGTFLCINTKWQYDSESELLICSIVTISVCYIYCNSVRALTLRLTWCCLGKTKQNLCFWWQAWLKCRKEGRGHLWKVHHFHKNAADTRKYDDNMPADLSYVFGRHYADKMRIFPCEHLFISNKKLRKEGHQKQRFFFP